MSPSPPIPTLYVPIPTLSIPIPITFLPISTRVKKYKQRTKKHSYQTQTCRMKQNGAFIDMWKLRKSADIDVSWYQQQIKHNERIVLPAKSAVILVNFTQQFPVPIPTVLPRWSLSHPHGDTATFVPVIAVFPLFSSRCRCLVQATTVDKL